MKMDSSRRRILRTGSDDHLQAVTLRLQLPHAGRNEDFAPVRRNMGRFGNK
jgi:hypothetical protein